MPVRAFLDSDRTWGTFLPEKGCIVSMPVRAFLDSDNYTRRITRSDGGGFQCPSGHFLIQTVETIIIPPQHDYVSMPVRAFLDSDEPQWRVGVNFHSVSMPVRAFLDSDWRRG